MILLSFLILVLYLAYGSYIIDIAVKNDWPFVVMAALVFLPPAILLQLAYSLGYLR